MANGRQGVYTGKTQSVGAVRQEGPHGARAERAVTPAECCGAQRAGPGQWECSDARRDGGAGDSVVGRGAGRALHGRGPGSGAAVGRRRGPGGGAVQQGGAGGAGATPRGGARPPLYGDRAAAHPGRGAPCAGPGARWDGHMVADDTATGAAAGARWAARGQYLHDLVRAARGGLDVATQPLVVRHGACPTAAPGPGGHGDRSRRHPKKTSSRPPIQRRRALA
jgi:hypothetical protein